MIAINTSCKKSRFDELWINVLVIVAVIAFLIYLAWIAVLYAWKEHSVDRIQSRNFAQATYNNYVEKFDALPLFQAKLGERMNLGEGVEITYLGASYSAGESNIDLGSSRGERIRISLPMLQDKTKVRGFSFPCYGDIDIRPVFGVNTTLHVLAAYDSSIDYKRISEEAPNE